MINKRDEKKKIVQLLYKGNGLSRQELNKSLQIRQTSLQEMIRELLDDGIIHEPGRRQKRTGARSYKLFVNPNFGFLLGLDIGSTSIKVVVTDFNCNIIYEEKGEYNKFEDKTTLFAEIFSTIDKIKSTKPEFWSKISGIGIADPGPVDIANGISRHAFNIKGWVDVPVVKIISEKYGIPAALLSASNAKALTEYYFSDSTARSTFVLDMGHGVGAGFIYEGELFAGSSHTEMEVGHIMVNINGRQCACGKRGCFEAEIGSDAIIDKFKSKIKAGAISLLMTDKSIEEITLYDIYDAYLKNDVVATSLVFEILEYLAKGLSYVIQMLNPQIIIIHGPITLIESKIANGLRHSLSKYCFPSVVATTDILFSSHGVFSAALGAAVLIRKKIINLSIDL
jgi:N-acetylglucosamine repressor